MIEEGDVITLDSGEQYVIIKLLVQGEYKYIYGASCNIENSFRFFQYDNDGTVTLIKNSKMIEELCKLIYQDFTNNN